MSKYHIVGNHMSGLINYTLTLYNSVSVVHFRTLWSSGFDLDLVFTTLTLSYNTLRTLDIFFA